MGPADSSELGIPPDVPASGAPASGETVLAHLAALGDETRIRILLLLDRGEFAVGEMAQVLLLPQSTVSRHLRMLAEGGWVLARSEGTSRHYRIATPLPSSARALWRVVRERFEGTIAAAEDGERARAVLSGRRERAQAFFRSTAGEWDGVRTELFGVRSGDLPLLGLLDPDAVAGDLGSGTGALSAAIAPFVHRVIAVDRAPEMLEAGRFRLRDLPNVEMRPGDLEALPIRDGELDLAFLVFVLHYLPDPRAALREAARALAPGGRLIVADMRAHAREEYRETMGHVWTGFTREMIEGWMEEAGFLRIRVVPLPPDPVAKGPLLFVATGDVREVEPYLEEENG